MVKAIACIIFIFLLTASSNRERNVVLKSHLNYSHIFGDEYKDAVLFVKKNQQILSIKGRDKDEQAFITSIAFPELIRYSLFRDFFETKSLELGYVNYGPEMVDFSIGPFQMKPSFVEQLENHLKINEQLKARHGSIILYKSDNLKDIRKERVGRLSDLKWQMRYLSCFFDIMETKYSEETWKSTEAKLRFYATAYNRGFNNSKETINNWKDVKIFPYGTSAQVEQCAYSDISIHFFTYYLKTLTNENEIPKSNNQSPDDGLWNCYPSLL